MKLNLPLTMRARLAHCWLFTWRTPEALVRALLPAPLELVTHRGFAFWNVVVCEMQGLRPAPLPAEIGVGYWHIAYRLHARARLTSGETVEGLYFVRSDCDRRLVSIAGNLLTRFRFHTAEVSMHVGGDTVNGSIAAPGANARFQLRDRPPAGLAPGSPFASLEEAAAFLKYKPCALAPAGPEMAELVRVRRREEAWRHRLVTVEESAWEFLDEHEVAPEICYAVEPIDYEWGRCEVHRVAP